MSLLFDIKCITVLSHGKALFADFVKVSSKNLLSEDLDLIKIARKSFDDKSKMQALPWLETEA